MKNSEKLQDALGYVRDDFLLDAQQEPARKHRGWVRWGAMAACLCLVAASALLLPRYLTAEPAPPSPAPDFAMGGDSPVSGGSMWQMPQSIGGDTIPAESTQPAASGLDDAPIPTQAYVPDETQPPQQTEPAIDPEDVIREGDRGVGFGLLYPTAILPGYRMIEGSYQVYGEDPAVLECRFEGDVADDQLLIRISRTEYFGEVPYGVVVYGDEKADGSRSSSMYFENAGFTILYQFSRADIAQMPDFWIMHNSAPCHTAE